MSSMTVLGYTFFDFFPEISEKLKHGNEIFGDPVLSSAHYGLKHVAFTGVLLILLLALALLARRKYTDRESALVPDGEFTVAGFLEVVFEAILDMMSEMMDEETARKYFPLIATLALFIFFGNVMGLVPGLYHPTSNLNTGMGCAIIVFLVYNIGGFVDHGIGYLKEFVGPVLWLAPLMIVVEMVSHAFRPISLSMRLTGNMTGDGLVLDIFGDLAANLVDVPFLLPVPFLFLGLLVSILQALIFAVLAAVYIALAHEDSH